MNKEKTLEAIQNARKAHEAQMAKILSLLGGTKPENPTTLSKTKCDFGLWLYEPSNRVEDILGSQFYTKLESLHAKWHSEYARIFEMFFKDTQKSFFSKFLGSGQLNPMELDKAKLYYAELQVTTNELLQVLSMSQRRITALNASLFR